MEPAVDRREHGIIANGSITPAMLPQWSPPLTGGNTLDTRIRAVLDTEPQWSPLLNGGSMAPGIRAV
jgi:hypothetical protein